MTTRQADPTGPSAAACEGSCEPVVRPAGPAVLIAAQAALALAGITVALTLAVIALIPVLIGWRSDVVVSGSMQPSIAVGDVVAISSAPAEVTPGMIVSFTNPDAPTRSMLHRVVSTDRRGVITTKGDANPTADSEKVTPTDVHGLGRIVVPAVGLPVQWLRTGAWLKLGLLVGAIGLALLALSRDRRLVQWHRHTEDHPACATVVTDGRLPAKHPHRAAWIATVATTVALVLLGMQTAFGAVHSSFSATTAASASWETAPATDLYRLAVLSDNPSLYVPMDAAVQSGNTLPDLSGNSVAVTAAGSWTYRVPSGPLVSAPGYAMSTQSTSTAVNVTNAAAEPTNWSIQVWFKTSGGGKLLSMTDGGSNANPLVTAYVATNGILRAALQNSSSSTVNLSSGVRVDDNTWHQLVLTSGTPSGGTKGTSLYLDGVSTATTTSVPRTSSSANTFFAYARDSKWSLTGEPSITSLVKNSQMGQVSTYATALTSTRVATYWSLSGN